LKPTEFKELVPEKTEALSKAAKESPFTIVVTVVPVDGERRVFLNKERVGTTADLNPLKEKLAQALERRRQAYRAGAGNERPGGADESKQREVFFSAPTSLKYDEAMKVIEAIRSVGAEPVGLQTEDPNAGQ
jgi:biopolymer transport protein ExbD